MQATLMIAYEGSESARDNFGKFIRQCKPENQDNYQETRKDLNWNVQTKYAFTI